MTETRLTKPKGALLVILAGVLWSTVGVAVKSMDEANSFQILFYRSLSLTFYIGIISLVFYNNIAIRNNNQRYYLNN